MNKRTDSRGETLVEVLASILIAALSAALLFSSVASSVRINRSAQTADEAYYLALTAAEAQAAPPSGEATVTVQGEAGTAPAKFDIHLYGGEGLCSYRRKEGAGP